MIALLGLIGSLCLGLCALPQVLHTWRTGDTQGLSWSFLLLWAGGEVALLGYVLLTTRDPVLLVNYVFNLLCLSSILTVKAGGEA